MRILVVEDERPIASFIRKGLNSSNYVVDVTYNGKEGLYLAKVNPYDLFIFDLMIPGIDGIELTKRVRASAKKNQDKPILILTAKDETKSKVEALDIGADDYLTKPFSFDEFLARIRALTRRAPKPITIKQNLLKYDDVELDIGNHTAIRRGKNLHLSKKEFSLLEYFLRNPGMVLTRMMILENVWDMNIDPFTNTVDVHIRFLRKKVDVGNRDKLIHTVHGIGYKFEKEVKKIYA